MQVSKQILGRSAMSVEYGLSELLGRYKSQLFIDVQLSGMFPDSKTFADTKPIKTWNEAILAYEEARLCEDFVLERFIRQHFEIPETSVECTSDTYANPKSYIMAMWENLKRRPDITDSSSLIALPNPYVVPGGRFREIYYWDSYFTALGLVLSGKTNLVESMMDNFVYLQREIGLIPNGNRDYYYTRSQPPVLSLMLELLCDSVPEKRSEFVERYLPALETEYGFWMSGSESLSEQKSTERRVVRLPNGALLNRYWDYSDAPRPESYKEDIELAHTLEPSRRGEFYRNIRAACESGWDFSSRWLADKDELLSIQTTNLIPVDLNALLFQLESSLCKFMSETGQQAKSEFYKTKADARKAAIKMYLWCEQRGAYFDFNWLNHVSSQTLSAATFTPMFVNLANETQARAVVQLVQRELLTVRGVKTTNVVSEQQWDAPNSWAPLNWFAVIAMEKYGFNDLAKQTMVAWLTAIEENFAQQGCLMEKYDVLNPSGNAQGGEYDVQEGFGWSNGVTQAFYRKLDL